MTGIENKWLDRKQGSKQTRKNKSLNEKRQTVRNKQGIR